MTLEQQARRMAAGQLRETMKYLRRIGVTHPGWFTLQRYRFFYDMTLKVLMLEAQGLLPHEGLQDHDATAAHEREDERRNAREQDRIHDRTANMMKWRQQ